MIFSEVIGQQAIKHRLIETVKNGRISHACLFVGNEGSGNLALALAYAQYVSCENRAPTDSCGTCRSCIKYNKLIHPDLHFVYPVVNTSSNSKAVSDDFLPEWRANLLNNPYMNLNAWVEAISTENKQGGIFERESGEIIRKLNLKTFEAEYKIMIIWMPEKMHVVAANKLLKMLEEPPQKTLFLLVAENSDQLLATILSRCQMLKIPALDNSDIAETLKKQGLADAQINELVRISEGNYFKVQQYLNSADDVAFNFEKFVTLMRLVYAFHGNKSKIKDIYQWINEMEDLGREKLKKFILNALRLIRDSFILNKQAPSLVYLNNTEFDFVNKFKPFIKEENIFKLNEEFSKAHYHIEANANAKIVLLDLALKMITYIRPEK